MHSITLTTSEQTRAIFARSLDWALSVVGRGKRVRLQLGEERRTKPQNDLIHPTVRLIAKEAGRPTDEDSLSELRRLLLEQWRFETGRKPAFQRSMDGLRWVEVSGGTSDLDKPDCSEFIDWLEAFRAQ